MEIRPRRSFRNRTQWRTWLKLHHATKNELWVVLYKANAASRGMTYDEAVEEALCFGWIDGILTRIDNQKHAIRFTPRRPKSSWSLINRKRALGMIRSRKMMPPGLEKISEAKKNGQWTQAYTSRKAERIPADLRRALARIPDGLRCFRTFAPSYRNMYIGWVKDARRPETRRRRIERVVKNTLRGIKPGIQLAP